MKKARIVVELDPALKQAFRVIVVTKGSNITEKTIELIAKYVKDNS